MVQVAVWRIGDVPECVEYRGRFECCGFPMVSYKWSTHHYVWEFEAHTCDKGTPKWRWLASFQAGGMQVDGCPDLAHFNCCILLCTRAFDQGPLMLRHRLRNFWFTCPRSPISRDPLDQAGRRVCKWCHRARSEGMDLDSGAEKCWRNPFLLRNHPFLNLFLKSIWRSCWWHLPAIHFSSTIGPVWSSRCRCQIPGFGSPQTWALSRTGLG